MERQNSSSRCDNTATGKPLTRRKILKVADASALPYSAAVTSCGWALVLSLPIIALTILLIPATSSGQVSTYTNGIIFFDCFTNGSTLNSTSPVEPTETLITNAPPGGTNYVAIYSTSYELVSGGTWSPTPSISSSKLDFGLAASSFAQNIQVQAIATPIPYTLGSSNDFIQLAVTFIDKKGILTNSAGGGGDFYMGLFYSGSVFNGDTSDTNFVTVTNLPVAGGMNGTAVNTYSNAATGSAQNWAGYSAQIANTGRDHRVNTRVGQTGVANNNQDVLLGNSLSSNQGYANPGPNISYSPASTLVLTNGRQYTALLTLVVTRVNTNGNVTAISNSVSLYAGADTTGALLMQYGVNLTGTNYVTNTFDAFAIGWYTGTGENAASEMDISQITVSLFQPSQIANIYLGDEDMYPDSNNTNALDVYVADNPDDIALAYAYDGTGTNTIEENIAGSFGTAGYTGDGANDANTGATLNAPEGVALDANGNLYIADTSNNVVREVTINGYVSTVAGNGTAGYSGDGGLATSAELNAPAAVCVDTNNNLYIADTGNNVIRKVSPIFHFITTVAGNGTAGYTGDGGSATSAELNAPIRVWVDDDDGGLDIGDYLDNVIREVNATNGTIDTTVTGGQ